MSQSSTAIPHGEKKHVRQVTRIAPAIPRHFAKKSSVDKGQAKASQQTIPTDSPVKELSNGVDTSKAGVVNGADGQDSESSGALIQPTRADQEPTTAPALEAVDEPTPVPKPVTPAATSSPVPIPHSSTANAISETASIGIDRTIQSTPSSGTSKSATSRPPMKLPPEFYPSLPAASTEHPAPRQAFVFGGQVDSPAPSPMPPQSSGSWTSGSGVGQTRDGMFPPPQPFSNDPRFQPGSQEHGSRGNGVETQGVVPPPMFAPGSHRGYAQPVNGHVSNGSRHAASRSILSPRSDSFSSVPSEHMSIPPGQAQPSIAHNNIYQNGYSNDSMTNLNRASQYGVFHPQRGSGHFDAWSAHAGGNDHNLQALRFHIESMFGQGTFADCVLRLPGGIEFPAHRSILSRSPRFNAMLRCPVAETVTLEGRPCASIAIPSSATFQDTDGFLRALRNLYGALPLRHTDFTYLLHAPQQALSHVLSYAAAGIFLEMPDIITTGLHLATELLLPENIPIALSFSLDPEVQQEPARADLLLRLTHFLAWYLSTGSFDFDASAPELDSPMRIPATLQQQPDVLPRHSSRQSVSTRKLQGIQLGDFSPQQSASRTLSSALLSIPSHVLQTIACERVLAERLSPSDRKVLIVKIVAERERRRVAARERWRAVKVEMNGDADSTESVVNDVVVRDMLEAEESVEDEEDGRVGVVVNVVSVER